MSSYPNLSPPTKSSNNSSGVGIGGIPGSLVPDYSPYSMSHHSHHHLHHTSYDPVGMGMMSSGVGMPVGGHQFTSGAFEPIYHPTSASSSIQQQFGKSLIESSGEQAQMTYDEHLSAVLSSRGTNELLVKKEDSSHHQHLHHNLHHNHLIHSQLQQSHQQYLDEKQVHLHQHQHQQQVSSGGATSNSLATMSSGLKNKSGKISSGGGHHQSSSSNQSIYF